MWLIKNKNKNKYIYFQNMAKKHPKIKKLIYVVLFPFSDFVFCKKTQKLQN